MRKAYSIPNRRTLICVVNICSILGIPFEYFPDVHHFIVSPLCDTDLIAVEHCIAECKTGVYPECLVELRNVVPYNPTF